MASNQETIIQEFSTGEVGSLHNLGTKQTLNIQYM